MAYSILSSNGNVQNNYVEYMLDTEADLTALPVSARMGSVAFVISTSTRYRKNSQNQWIPENSANSGGGSGNGGASSGNCCGCLDGVNTIVGKSAYEIAVQHGFIGDEEAWLESLKGSSEILSISNEEVLEICS